MTFVASLAALASLTLFATTASAQAPGGDKAVPASREANQPTVEKDDTYGKGGTKETTSEKGDDGTVTREVWKDKDGRPVRAVEKDGGNETEVEWKYDKQGRITSVLVRLNKQPRWIVRRRYKDGNDETGNDRIEYYDDVSDDWRYSPAAPKTIEAILKRFGLVLFPKIVHLTVGPTPKPEPPVKPEPPKKEPLKQQKSQALPMMGAGPSEGAATTRLVGLVYDLDSRQGDRVTVTLTTDPRKFASIPTLGVIEMTLPASPSTGPAGGLESLVVDLGDGRTQRADQPLTIQIAQDATSIPVEIRGAAGGTPVAGGSIPVVGAGVGAAVPDTGRAKDFTAPPVCQGPAAIHGPLSGDARMTRITVDGAPVDIDAATPRSVHFNVPDGPHTVTVRDAGREASFRIVRMSLLMQADQSNLLRGHSTGYSATLKLAPLPASLWRNGGPPSEAIALSRLEQLAPAFHPPKPGEPAVILLVIENASRETVSIKPSENEVVRFLLHERDFANPESAFTHAGVIKARKDGTFTLNGIAQAFFAPVHGQEVPRGVLGGGPGTRGPVAVPLATTSIDGSEFDEDGKQGKKHPGVTFSDDVKDPCKKQGCPKPGSTKKGIYCRAVDNCGGKGCPTATCRMFVAWADPKDPKIPNNTKDPEKWRATAFGVAPKDKDIPKDKDLDFYAIKPEKGKVYGCGCQ